jgi:flagellar basal body-associated protein FliL
MEKQKEKVMQGKIMLMSLSCGILLSACGMEAAGTAAVLEAQAAKEGKAQKEAMEKRLDEITRQVKEAQERMDEEAN